MTAGMRRRAAGLLLVAACGCASAPDARCDLAWTQERVEIRSGRKRTVRERVSITPDRMKIEDPAGGASTVLRLDKGVVWLVDGRDGSYRARTFRQLQRERDQRWKDFKKQRRAKDAKYDRIPDPAMRKRMKALLERQARGKAIELGVAEVAVDVVRTGEQRDINGYPCEEIRVTDRDTKEPVFHGWVSAKVGHEDLLKVFREKLKLFAADLASSLEKAGAFPLQGNVVTRRGAVKVRIRFTVTDISDAPIPDAAFDLPAGYKEKPWEDE